MRSKDAGQCECDLKGGCQMRQWHVICIRDRHNCCIFARLVGLRCSIHKEITNVKELGVLRILLIDSSELAVFAMQPSGKITVGYWMCVGTLAPGVAIGREPRGASGATTKTVAAIMIAIVIARILIII